MACDIDCKYYSEEAADKIAVALKRKGIEYSVAEEGAHQMAVFRFSLPMRGAAEGLLEFSLEMGDIYMNHCWSCIIRALLPIAPDKGDKPVDRHIRYCIHEYCSRVNQKYHRGCMYMDEEDRIWFRDYYEFSEEDDLTGLVDFIYMLVSEAESHGFGIYHILTGMVPRDALEISETVNKMICMDLPIESKAELEARTNAMFAELAEKVDTNGNISSGSLANGPLKDTERMILGILKKKPDSSRAYIADKISESVRTVQSVLKALEEKGYIRQIGSKQRPLWEFLK